MIWRKERDSSNAQIPVTSSPCPLKLPRPLDGGKSDVTVITGSLANQITAWPLNSVIQRLDSFRK